MQYQKEAKRNTPLETDINEITSFQMQYFSEMDSAANSRLKQEEFKNRLNQFKTVQNIDEAKELLDLIMPVKMEKTVFYIGSAKCTIIKKEDLIKITYKSPVNIIMYSFK